MCNLYRLKVPRDQLLLPMGIDRIATSQIAMEKDYSAPGKPGMIVREEGGRRVLDTMLWGFPENKRERKIKPKAGQSAYLYDWYTNARNLRLGMWSRWLETPAHRCLVPFTEFAEPKAAIDRAAPDDLNWWFSVKGQPVAAFAGIWKVHPDAGPVYAFLTCAPNDLIAPKHPKAMPVILAPEDYAAWLTGDYADACALALPFEAAQTAVV
ncbi:DUF159 family protein [Sphingobium jiangsuense]|uniref:Putative SOS response-associated peptidase YedK n=1 Tax=Sphingobium jiangsuense TaxID=870476 RepID=A0A7W6BDX9_9SPHN|nr:SOS response-associated peptidase family protein [Sphingobium jiangsuense]MBB3925023.1 putative SOS response-associated peptidase YedK [Sphingobium jiangsuense]GLT00147.1 DUF159 family protein [Sphingobium jiangsuense]